MLELVDNIDFFDEQYGGLLHPLCLPMEPAPVDTHLRVSVYVAGYGAPSHQPRDNLGANHLRQGHLSIFSQKECRAEYNDTASPKVAEFLRTYLPGQIEQDALNETLMCAKKPVN